MNYSAAGFEIQRAGLRVMKAGEFARGSSVRPGTRFE